MQTLAPIDASALAELLSRRGATVKSNPNGEYVTTCPCHEDTHPSLNFRNTSSGEFVCKCWSGCSQSDLFKALANLYNELNPNRDRDKYRPTRKLRQQQNVVRLVKPERQYSGTTIPIPLERLAIHPKEPGTEYHCYATRNDTGMMVVVRITRVAGDSKKKIVQTINPVGNPAVEAADWKLKPSNFPVKLYRQSELTGASSLCVVAGESKADHLFDNGYEATTWISGDTYIRRHLDLLDSLPSYPRIILLPDNDASSRDSMQAVGDYLRSRFPQADLRVVDFGLDEPALEGYDVGDYIRQGHPLPALLEGAVPFSAWAQPAKPPFDLPAFMQRWEPEVRPVIDKDGIARYGTLAIASACARSLEPRIALTQEGTLVWVRADRLSGRKTLKVEVGKLYKSITGQVLPDSAGETVSRSIFDEAIETEDTAISELRTAEERDSAGNITLWHAINQGAYVKISADGVELREVCPHIIKSQQSLVRPNLTANFHALDELLINLDFDNKVRYLCALFASFVQSDNKNVVVIEGDKGTGKSTLCDLFALLHDGRVNRDKIDRKITEKDYAAKLSRTSVPCYDNVEAIDRDWSDRLCLTATGYTLTVRALYSDDATHSLSIKRTTVLTGISVKVPAADLKDRCVFIRTKSPEEMAKLAIDETTLRDRIQALLPDILGAVLRHLAVGIARNLHAVGKQYDYARNTRAMSIAVGATMSALGIRDPHIIFRILSNIRAEKDLEVAEMDELVDGMVRYVEDANSKRTSRGPVELTAQQWLEVMRVADREWVGRKRLTSSTLSKELRGKIRLFHLRGYEISFDIAHHRNIRKIRIGDLQAQSDLPL